MRVLLGLATLVGALAGQCSPSDEAFWKKYGVHFSNFMAGCVMTGYGKKASIEQCMKADKHWALSAGCTDCFATFGACTFSECSLTCLTYGVGDKRCWDCNIKTHCPKDLYDCTGYGLLQLPTNQTGTEDHLPDLRLMM
ncbi:hypothetical protein FOL47_003149 [Perkinsus chesapeaki]|uniref:Immunoglobulin super DCC subclass member n=1 Tax=Perkinsus chesapeaki TaxID=330153 RepID=A0A7J6M9A4_PERCH|nr:hypothetical protein FOL47_003149 [Perkinsus chesapeaki]